MKDDDTWTQRAGPIPLQIGLATFGILALELALIRWTAGQVRAFAYFTNLVLIGAFLGMGLGLALGRRHPGLVHWTLPTLALLALVLGPAEPLGLVRLAFPDPSVHLWGSESIEGGLPRLAAHLGIFAGLVAGIVAVFICAGAAVGCLFPRLPALSAYRWDLLGSLLGVLAITGVTATGAGPAAWLALGVLPFAWLSRRPLSLLSALIAVGLGAYSVRGAQFSPYNRIDLSEGADGVVLEVNRDFHQYIHNLSDEGVETAPEPDTARARRLVYELPFSINERRGSALIVGAGTGNDAAGALRQGYARVVSVDIDPRIVELGRRLHPERPYDDPRAEAVVDDARAFFEKSRGETFDAVVFGLLDSHAMFSALTTLRLDNYVYTEQALRAAWEHVGPGGHLSVSFSVFGGQWIFDRLYWTIERATGREPVTIAHRMNYGCTFIVPRDDTELHLERVPFGRALPSRKASAVRTTSDDWPFLYVRPGVFPWGYVIVLGGLISLALVAMPLAFGRSAMRADFDPVLFLMGAGFLLIETRGVTALSVLFGSTWVVNAVVFAGILAMALCANEVVARLKPSNPTPWFLGLILSVLLLWYVPPSALTGLSLMTRGVLGGLVTGLPVAFAGVIVSIWLASSANAAASLGSNLLGSVIGGCLEYLSMIVGLRALALLALALYLAAFLIANRRRGALFV